MTTYPDRPTFVVWWNFCNTEMHIVVDFGLHVLNLRIEPRPINTKWTLHSMRAHRPSLTRYRTRELVRLLSCTLIRWRNIMNLFFCQPAIRKENNSNTLVTDMIIGTFSGTLHFLSMFCWYRSSYKLIQRRSLYY